jgi:hypothetical protein
MIDLLFAIFVALICLGTGKRLLDRLAQSPEHPLDAVAVALPLGMGLLSLGTLVLGELRWLNGMALSALLAVWMELGLVPAFRFLADVRRRARVEDRDRSAASRVLAFCSGSALLGTALVALGPVTDGDALCYHLQVPKQILMHQAIGVDPDLHETVYPLVTELLYLPALEFRGPVACRWIQWVFGLVLFANVTALARPTLGRRAWWAGAIVLLAPAVSNGMSAPLNDVALAAFGMAAVFAWTRLLDRPSLTSAAVAGLMAGLAAGVKYPALVLIVLLTAATAWRSLKRPAATRILERLTPVLRRRHPSSFPPRGDVARRADAREPATGSPACPTRSSDSFVCRPSWLTLTAVYVAVAVLMGGCWYVRAYRHTCNPVYPFFRQVFGGAGLDEVLDPIKRPMAVTPWNLLLALGPLTLQPDRFDSFSHQFGPIFLLFLPVALVERLPRRVLGLTTLGYAFLTLCLTQRQSMRFVLIALGPLAIAVAQGASAWCDRKTLPARLMLGILLAALGFEASLALARGRHVLGMMAGRESAESLLARREPTFVVGRWAAHHLPATAHLIGQDHRGFYIPRPYTMELAHRRRTGLDRRGEAPDQIVARLRDAGFTHLMLCPPVPETAVEFDPTLGRLLAPWLAGRVPLYREDLTDGDGVLRRYAIYELSEERVASHDARGPAR